MGYTDDGIYSPPREGGLKGFFRFTVRSTKKLFLYFFTLFFGFIAAYCGLFFAQAIYSGRFVDAKPVEQGEIFGTLMAAIVLAFLAKKAWTNARWG